MLRRLVVAFVLLTVTSSCVSAPPQSSPPAAPGALTVMEEPGPQVRLAWSDNAVDEEYFVVERRTGEEDFGPLSPYLPTNTEPAMSFTDQGVTAGAQYEYRVRAVRGGSSSDPSNAATVTLLVPDHLAKVRSAYVSADTPRDRGRAILAECEALSRTRSVSGDFGWVYLQRIDGAFGQALMSGDKDLLRDSEGLAAGFLQRFMEAGADESSGMAQSAAGLLVDFWEEARLLDARSAALEAGAVEPYGEQARWLLLRVVRERKDDQEGAAAAYRRQMEAGGRPVAFTGGVEQPASAADRLESLLTRARLVWDSGDKLSEPARDQDAGVSALPVITTGNSVPATAIEGMASCFEQILSAPAESPNATAPGTGSAEVATPVVDRFAALRERAKAQKGDPFWQSLDLFLTVRAPSGQDAGEAEKALDEYLERYPASTWALGLLVTHYSGQQSQGDALPLAAKAETLGARLPTRSAIELELTVAQTYMSAGKLPEAVSWFDRSYRRGTALGAGPVATLIRIAGQAAGAGTTGETRAKIAGLIRGLLADPVRAPVLTLTEMRQLKAALASLESSRSS